MKLKNIIFLGSDTFSIVSCTIRDPSPRDFSLMTLLTVFERVKTHTYGGVRLMLIFLKLRGPSIKDVDNKEGG